MVPLFYPFTRIPVGSSETLLPLRRKTAARFAAQTVICLDGWLMRTPSVSATAHFRKTRAMGLSSATTQPVLLPTR